MGEHVIVQRDATPAPHYSDSTYSPSSQPARAGRHPDEPAVALRHHHAVLAVREQRRPSLVHGSAGKRVSMGRDGMRERRSRRTFLDLGDVVGFRLHRVAERDRRHVDRDSRRATSRRT